MLKLRLFLILVLLSSPLAFAENDQKFMGTASCSSSNCHGSVNPRNGNKVLQNEYVTWQKQDKHSQAYNVLLNEESKIIAKHLGIASAKKEPLCLKCHSTYVPNQTERGEKFQTEDGVSCESCHGSSEKWLSTHISSGVTHQQNINNGMTDLNNRKIKNNLCISCHFGNDDKSVNHRLIGAGHPRLTFEADTFETIMPVHWEIDKDYIERKGDYNASSNWLSGQLALAEESINRILSKKRSTNENYPEFSLFYCYSCHHSLSPNQWKSRDYSGHPGDPTLNMSSLTIVNLALNTFNSSLAAELEGLMTTLHNSHKSGESLSTLNSLSKFLKNKAVILTKEELKESQNKKLLKALINYAADTPFLQYEVAEQILMGSSSILASSTNLNQKFKADVNNLYSALKNENEFIAENFTKVAQGLKAKVGK